jgi:hypothetical protein
MATYKTGRVISPGPLDGAIWSDYGFSEFDSSKCWSKKGVKDVKNAQDIIAITTQNENISCSGSGSYKFSRSLKD